MLTFDCYSIVNTGRNSQPGAHQFLSQEERQKLGDDVVHNAQGGGPWVGAVALLLHHPHAKDEDRQSLAAAWRAQPPLMGTRPLVGIGSDSEIELWEQSAESTEEVIQRWEAHWAEVVIGGTVRQRKVVAKAVLRRLLNRSKDIHAGVEWFIRNERQLRSAEGRIQLAWVNVLEETLMENVYARRVALSRARTTTENLV